MRLGKSGKQCIEEGSSAADLSPTPLLPRFLDVINECFGKHILEASPAKQIRIAISSIFYIVIIP